MSKDPAFLFYSSNFLSGTMFMSDEQVGKYIRLLCAQHQNGRMTEKQVVSICKTKDPEIFAKLKCDDGFYFNEKLEDVIEKRRNFTESRRNNGSKGGRPKKSEKPSAKPSANLPINTNINTNIIEYLNKVSGKNFKKNTKVAVDCISARLNEGFTFEDFKQVIDHKNKTWRVDPKMQAFIRPQTLFGNKFDSYLNEIPKKSAKKISQPIPELPKVEPMTKAETEELNNKLTKMGLK